jgi:hypothetical protein
MRTNNKKSNINKTNMTNKKNAAKAAVENKKTLARLLREDCQNLVEVAKTERDDDGRFLTYEDKAMKAKFFMAYEKARLHFGELAKTGEEGKKLAHVIFGKEAHESVEFRCTENHYLRMHPEMGGFFDVNEYYDYTRKKSPEEKIQDRIAAENSAREAKREKAVVSNGRRNRRIIAIAIVILIAVAAFAVAVYKKGLKPVLKAIAFGACCVTVILAFKKAQDAVLDRIKNKFYGNK